MRSPNHVLGRRPPEKAGRTGQGRPRYASNLNPMKNPFKNKYVLIFLCLFVLVGCVTALTGGLAFVQEHSMAILIVFLLIILILDLIT